MLEDHHSHFRVTCESLLLAERELVLLVEHGRQKAQRWTLRGGDWDWCWLPDGSKADEAQSARSADEAMSDLTIGGVGKSALTSAIDDLKRRVELCDYSEAHLLAERILAFLDTKFLPSLQERVEALKYYGVGDEGGELFQATCGLCYRMYGLGQCEWAEELYLWAADLAAASRSYQESDKPGEMDDFEHGEWAAQ